MVDPKLDFGFFGILGCEVKVLGSINVFLLNIDRNTVPVNICASNQILHYILVVLRISK